MSNQIQELIKNLEGTLNNNTVIGEPIKVDGATIVPLIEVNFGMAAGSFDDEKGAGGMGCRMIPYALLVVQNGMTKLINIKNQDAISKAIDLVPDVVNRFTGKKIDKDVILKAKKMAEEA